MRVMRTKRKAWNFGGFFPGESLVQWSFRPVPIIGGFLVAYNHPIGRKWWHLYIPLIKGLAFWGVKNATYYRTTYHLFMGTQNNHWPEGLFSLRGLYMKPIIPFIIRPFKGPKGVRCVSLKSSEGVEKNPQTASFQGVMKPTIMP